MKYFVWCHSSRELSLRRSKHTACMTHVISAEEPRPLRELHVDFGMVLIKSSSVHRVHEYVEAVTFKLSERNGNTSQ